MNTTTLAVVEPSEAVSLLESPLSPAEAAQLQSCEFAIELAGKDRLEKALIIGEKLSTIYNGALFRGADGGCTWEHWVSTKLPQLLPGESPKLTQADNRRFLWEVRVLLQSADLRGLDLPETLSQAEALKALIPRESKGECSWHPAVLQEPEAAHAVASVWALAHDNAVANDRRKGPTAEDVRSARDELRPALERQGMIRPIPASQSAATAASIQAVRSRTVDVTPPDPAKQEKEAAAFRDTMAGIRATAPERTAKVEAQGVSDELSKAEREHRQMLDEEVRHYSRCLVGASKAIHELLSYLESLSRIHGTALLDEMRCIDVMGLITVNDDMQRLQEMGKELMEAVKLARSSAPSTGVNMTTLDV